MRALSGISYYYNPETMEKPIVIVVDGNSAHRSRAVKRWLEDNPQVSLYFLPKNSPELNPIEYFWRRLRKEVTHGRVYTSVTSLKMAIQGFFNRWHGLTRWFRQWLSSLLSKIWNTDTLGIHIG